MEREQREKLVALKDAAFVSLASDDTLYNGFLAYLDLAIDSCVRKYDKMIGEEKWADVKSLWVKKQVLEETRRELVAKRILLNRAGADKSVSKGSR